MSYLRKRGKKWYYTIELDTGGKRQRIERAGGRTKAEAEKARAQALAQYTQTGRIDRGRKITYQELSDEWARESLSQARAATRANYKNVLKNHILPVLGKKRLRDIRPRNIQALMNDEASAISVSLMNNIHAVLSLTFDYAIFCEYLTDTPMRGVKTPEAQPLKKRRAFTQEEFRQLLSYYKANRPELILPILIAYHTGARCGEILALTWEDADFSANTLTINKTQIHGNAATIQPTTKSKSGVRTIAIGAALVKALKAARAEQAKDRLRYGAYYRDSGRICRRKDGTPLTHNHINSISHYCRKHFPPGLCFHSLRHTHATLLLEAGEDLELVSKRLGHANISTTASVYSHILAHRQQAERDLLDRIFL